MSRSPPRYKLGPEEPRAREDEEDLNRHARRDFNVETAGFAEEPTGAGRCLRLARVSDDAPRHPPSRTWAGEVSRGGKKPPRGLSRTLPSGYDPNPPARDRVDPPERSRLPGAGASIADGLIGAGDARSREASRADHAAHPGRRRLGEARVPESERQREGSRRAPRPDAGPPVGRAAPGPGGDRADFRERRHRPRLLVEASRREGGRFHAREHVGGAQDD